MNADKLILSVLNEARGRPAVDDDRRGKDYNFSRRESRFTSSASGYIENPPRKPLVVHPETTFKETFGGGFKNDETHFRNAHLIPMLAHGAMSAASMANKLPQNNIGERLRLSKIALESASELNKHLVDLTNEIHSYCEKRQKGLLHGPIIKDPTKYTETEHEFFLTHDTLDHGQVGALPHKFGEYVAAHNANVRRINHEHRKTNSIGKEEYKEAMEAAKTKTMSGLLKFYGSIASVRIAKGVPSPVDYHGAVMDISRRRKSWKKTLASLKNRNAWHND